MSTADAMPAFLGMSEVAASPVASILPVPYDATSTWKKGADRGPRALLEASAAVELYDLETASEPYRAGIDTLPPLVHAGGPEELADRVAAAVAEILAAGRLPIVLGGEHSVSIGAIGACAARFERLSVLQIDAHADTRDRYQGSSHNHACVMARARELCPIVQVGIRSVDAGEMRDLDQSRVFWAHDIVGRRDWIDSAVELLTEDVYVTIDLDAFDPSILPATGTPEPGGLDWYAVTALLAQVVQQRRVVGFDVVELLPDASHHACDFVAAKLVHRLLAMILANRPELAAIVSR